MSSTEAELIAAVTAAKNIKYICSILFELGVPCTGPTPIYKDNKSAIKIINANKPTGRSRHINIRYFWIKDRIDQEEVRVEYLPTHIMLADYYTKPLQGSRFRNLREFIMEWRPMLELIVQKIDEDKSVN